MGLKVGDFLGLSPMLSAWRNACSGDVQTANDSYALEHGDYAVNALRTAFNCYPNYFNINSDNIKRFAISCALREEDIEIGDIFLEEGLVEDASDFRALAERYGHLYTNYVGYMPANRNRIVFRSAVSSPRTDEVEAMPILGQLQPRDTNSQLFDQIYSTNLRWDTPTDEETDDEEYDEDYFDDDESEAMHLDSYGMQTGGDYRIHMKKEEEINEKFKVEIPLNEYIKPDFIIDEDEDVYVKARREYNSRVAYKIDWIFNRTEREGFNRRNIEMFTLDEITKRIEKRGSVVNGKHVYDWKLGDIEHILRMELDAVEHGNENVPPISLLTVRAIHKPLGKETGFYVYIWNGTRFDCIYSNTTNNNETTLKNIESDRKYFKEHPQVINTRGWRIHSSNDYVSSRRDEETEWSENMVDIVF